MARIANDIERYVCLAMFNDENGQLEDVRFSRKSNSTNDRFL